MKVGRWVLSLHFDVFMRPIRLWDIVLQVTGTAQPVGRQTLPGEGCALSAGNPSKLLHQETQLLLCRP